MAKTSYIVEPDGSITFESDVSDEVRAKAYEDAARQRAAATDVEPAQRARAQAAAAGTAYTTVPREKATEVFL